MYSYARLMLVVKCRMASLARLLDREAKGLPAWSLVVGFEGRARHVSYQEDKVRGLFAKVPCKPVEDLIDPMTEELDRPWMEATPNHTAFFALFSRMKDLDTACDRAAGQAGVPEERVGIDVICDGELYRFDVNLPETNEALLLFAEYVSESGARWRAAT